VAFVQLLAVPGFKGEVDSGDPWEREVRTTRNTMLVVRDDIEDLEYECG